MWRLAGKGHACVSFPSFPDSGVRTTGLPLMGFSKENCKITGCLKSWIKTMQMFVITETRITRFPCNSCHYQYKNGLP